MGFDCQTCGACCRGLDVLLDEDEAARFESRPDFRRLTFLHRPQSGPPMRFMKRDPKSDRCVALAGPLQDCRCTIYRDRPALCRQLQPGSPHCLEARQKVYGAAGNTPTDRNAETTASA